MKNKRNFSITSSQWWRCNNTEKCNSLFLFKDLSHLSSLYDSKFEEILKNIINNIQFSSVTQSCLTLCDPMNCSTPGLPVHHQLPESIKTHVHWVSDDIQPPHPLFSPSPPALNLSQCQSLFQWVALHIRWPKYWSFSFSISPSSEYSGLISFIVN